MSTTSAAPAQSLGRGILRLYRTLWQHAAGIRVWVVGFFVLLLGAQLVRLAVPYFFGSAVNELQDTGRQDLGSAAMQLGLMFGACALAWALHGPGRVIERFSAVYIRGRFTDALYGKAVGLPLQWHEQHHSGETIQRMGQATGALWGFSQDQFIYLQNAVSLAGPIVAMFLISGVTGTAALVGYGLIALLLTRFDGTMLRLVHQENKAERRYFAELVDSLGNIATVLTLRLQAATRRALGDRLAEVFVPLKRGIVVTEVKWCAVDLLNCGLRCGLVGLYAWLAWRESGIVLVGTVVMINQYAEQIGGVVGAMASHWQELVRRQADISAADDILHAAERRKSEAGGIPADWHEIDVRELRFDHAGRRGNAPSLDGITLPLRRGGRIALIGESGSGKSTVLRVLAGLYQADRAGFIVDGVLRADLRDLGGVATLIPQDPEVFESTIERNITLGIDHDPDELRRACELACLTSVLDRLPAGLATEISERGLNLSGGQKQRLALARGILASKDSSLIMMDEPTSSMDPVTEARIYDNILAEFPEACIVSSVHRLHLLNRFDTVVLLADGRVVDAGSTEELLARQPRFQAMWQGYVGGAVERPAVAAPVIALAA
jgi:ATP-binding cassette, subfamily B, bacterial